MRLLWEQSLLRGGQAGEFTLLASHGSMMLWEQALGKDAVPGFDLEQNAELARRSWQLALEYGLNLERLQSEADGEDEGRFVRWAARFEELRRSGNWLEPAALPQLLAEDLESGAITVAGPLHLLGFDSSLPIPPPQSRLLDAIRSAGVSVLEAPQAPRATRIVRAGYETPDDELEAAARWAGNEKTGVILIDFADRAARARCILLDCLQPAWQTRGFPQDAPLNSAEAPPLSHAGPVEMAIDALHLLLKKVDFETASRVLRGAYLNGSDGEAGLRARLERELRGRLLGSEITRTQLLLRVATTAPQLADAVRKGLKASKKIYGKDKTQSCRIWSSAFTAFLGGLGWPGERPLVSSEQQAVEAFNRLLSDFGGCDAVAGGGVDLPKALARLSSMARERRFQPQGPDQAVELLPIDESAGMHFRRLWVAGMGANLWPKAIRPAPLLPLGLQIGLGMPQAGSQEALNRARRQTEALLRSADEVVFSWSAVTEEGVETSCSPLIAQICEGDPLDGKRAGEAPPYAEELRQSAELETLAHDAAPPLQPEEEIKGGTRLMDHQLRNPFRAFAEHRLHAAEYPPRYDGISPLDRGSIVHKLMLRIYKDYGDAESLADALPELRPLLKEWVANIPDKEPPGLRPLVLGLLQMERERTVQMAMRWAHRDLEREEFRVEGLEEKEELALGPVTLTMRLDRVDHMAIEGETVALVLDYKTGRELALSGLNPARLRSSQLPAYALATPGVAGVGYIFLSPDRQRTKGICDNEAEEKMPGLTPISRHKDFRSFESWQDVLDAWRVALTGAALDLCRGDARIEVFSYEKSARGQYQVLSRIQELERAEVQA